MKNNPQSEFSKTIFALILSGAMVGVTCGVYYATGPSTPNQYAKVGQQFFEKFEGSDQIAEMDLIALDVDGKLQSFSLKKAANLWTIPSHYNYPAEAGQRLSQTATELIGLNRTRLASAEREAQPRLGVLDPTTDQGKESPEDAGKLIRFTDSNDELVFALIIGKPLEATDQQPDVLSGISKPDEKLYHVRIPSETETYVAKLDLDISTKFSDWINKDLLELTSASLRKLNVDNYRLESRQVLTPSGIAIQKSLVPGEELELAKSSDRGQWEIANLDAEKEEVDTDKINQLVGTIEKIELAGVRPRFQYDGKSVLDANFDIQVPESLANNPEAQQAVFSDLQDDLSSRGFALAQNPENQKIMLVSDYGEMSATTAEGLTYTLYYGAQISGSEQAIEIGSPDQDASTKDKASDTGEKDYVGTQADPSEATGGEGNDADQKKLDPTLENKSRFLLVKVEFNSELVEGKPVEPMAPERMQLPVGFGEPENSGGMPTPEFDIPPGPSLPGPSLPGPSLPESSLPESSLPESSLPESSLPESSLPGTDSPASTPAIAEPATRSTPIQSGLENDKSNELPGGQAEPSSEGSGGLFTIQDQPIEGISAASGIQDQLAPSQEISRQEIEKAMEAEYQRQLKEFENQKVQYETDLKSFQDDATKFQQKADRLNERFADWYYVVPASDLEELRVIRKDVVKPLIKQNQEGVLENPLGFPGFPESQIPGQ